MTLGPSVRWAVKIFLIVVFLSAGPASAVTETELSNEFVADARKFIEEGDTRGAIVELKNALQSDPSNLSARLLLGEIYVDAGKGPAAEKELRKVWENGINLERVLVLLGRAYLMQGKYQKVLDDIIGGNFEPEVEAGILLARGHAHLGLGEADQALESLRQASELRPDDARIHVGFARILIGQRKLEEAEKKVDLGLALDPNLVEALVIKGELRRLARDNGSALENFSKAITVDGNSIMARLGRAAVSVKSDRADEALKDLELVLEKSPKHPLANYLAALIEARKKDFAVANERLTGLGAIIDNHLPSNFLLGALHYLDAEYEQALERLGRFLDGVPGHVTARKLMGATQIRKRQAAQAVTVLEPALETAPNDVQLLALLGSAYMQVGEFTKGTELFERTAAASPDATGIRTQLALSRLATGEAEKAIEDLESVIELDADATQAGILLTLTHLRSRDFEAAFEVADRLRENDEDNPLYVNLMGAALLGEGDTASARDTFNKALALDPDYFPAEMNLAQIDIRERKYVEAKQRYESIVERDRDNLPVMNALAKLAVAEHRDQDAVKWFERARAAHPQAAAPRIRLVNLYIRMRESAKAMAVALELDQFAHNNPKAVDALGRAQAAAGEMNSAVGTFKRLVELTPSSAEAHHRLAAALVAADELPKARDLLLRAIEINPDYAIAQAALVELEIRDERYDEALAIVDELREKRPDSPVPDVLAASIKMNIGDFGEAAVLLERALEMKKHPAIARRLHSAHARAGNMDAAIAVLENWVAENPRDQAMKISLAAAYLEGGRYDESIASHEEILAQDGDNPVILNNLAWLYHKLDDPRGLEFARQAYKIAPNSPEVVDTLGWILVQTGENDRGLTLLEKASAQAPQASDIRYHFAVALNRVGKRHRAV